MKTKFELSVTISEEERDIIEKAENILQEICLTFDEHNQCELCPMHSTCTQKLNHVSTPHSILYNIRNSLEVEGEE